MFVILSGYGFSESIKSKNIGLFAFYQKRLITLYSNYWLIALLFVPIGIVIFGRTLQDVFTSHPYAKFLIQMTGLHRYAYNEYGYNATWWYMSVIIPLVVLFPFLYDLTKKYGILILLFSFVILLPDRDVFPVINTWILPFILGIYFSQRELFVTIRDSLVKIGHQRFVISVIALVLMEVIRNQIPLLNSVKYDWLLGSLLIFIVFDLSVSFKVIGIALSFLGLHLFNIFLFHTFIYCYYGQNFIYSFKYPIPIFCVLLIVCITISISIEKIKGLIRYNKFIVTATRVKIPSAIEIEFQKDALPDTRTVRP